MIRIHYTTASLIILVLVILLVTFLVLVCADCGRENVTDRFTVEDYGRDEETNIRFHIITDTETGAQYFLATRGQSMAMADLCPGEG